MIDITKTYRTRCGYPVRIYATDGAGLYPVHGAYCAEGVWIICIWAMNGEFSLLTGEDCRDLVEVKPRIVREVWVNVYNELTSLNYLTKQQADQDAGFGRLACVKLIIDCEEGEGLE